MEDYYQPRDNQTTEKYESILGIFIAIPEWEAIITATVLSIIVLMTLVGNILVILSVFKHKPLRIAQNFFLVSLAVADLTVGVLVLPLSIINTILGQWKFGKFVCTIWLTCDILCCTASILNLCAIALDRYRAITDPLNYARKRTLKRVLVMIGGVWVLSAIISSPPLFGWNDWPAVFNESTKCELTKRQGYVVYSSLGSFYIPLFIMAIVYMEIFIATKRRLRERARASTLSAIKYNQTQKGRRPSGELDSMSSDTNVEEVTPKSPQNIADRCVSLINKYVRKTSVVSQDSFTDENGDPPSSPQYVTKSPKTRRQSIKSSRSQKIKDAENPKQRISLSKERRAARTLGIIMGVFVICWLPFFLMYVIVPFCHSCDPSEKLLHFITWLGYINSAANPVIYTIFNMDFRKAFKKLLHISI